MDDRKHLTAGQVLVVIFHRVYHFVESLALATPLKSLWNGDRLPTLSTI